jgi:hypothetical protein
MRRGPMTSKQPDQGPEAPEVKLEPLHPEPVEVDAHRGVYGASIRNRDAVCAFTITVAPQLYETKELKELLNAMKAGLAPAKANQEEDTADDGEPVPAPDLANVIDVEVRLTVPDDTLGVTVVVETPVPEEEDPKAAQFRAAPGRPGEPQIRATVLAGKDLRFNAAGGITRTATATALAGSGTLRKQQAQIPSEKLIVGRGSKSVRGKTIYLHASTQRMVANLVF